MGHSKGVNRAIKPMFKRGVWRIVRGDSVMIVAGKDRGATGTVLKVFRDVRRPRVLVEGRNLVRTCAVAVLSISGGGAARPRQTIDHSPSPLISLISAHGGDYYRAAGGSEHSVDRVVAWRACGSAD